MRYVRVCGGQAQAGPVDPPSSILFRKSRDSGVKAFVYSIARVSSAQGCAAGVCEAGFQNGGAERGARGASQKRARQETCRECAIMRE